MVDLAAVRKTLDAHGQSHLLGFWDELDAPARTALLDQIAAIDFDRLDDAIRHHVIQRPEAGLSQDIQPPRIIPADETQTDLRNQGLVRGEELISAGKIAAFVVAGGQGTRLGYEGPKGCFEATPVSHKPLFQIFAEQILAAGGRGAKPIPWYVMTSPANDVATQAFFRRHRFFGLDLNDVFFFSQGTMPAINFEGKILLADKGQVSLSPDGHGGCLPAMRASGALADMAARGVELISYFQVDNPLVRCIDPVFLGLHDLQGAEMSAKCLAKRDPMERLGNFCVVDGKVTVIEYSDMPEPLARACTQDGRLRFSAGSIAVHVLSRSFVERLTAGGTCALPLHRAEKKVSHVAPDGRAVKGESPNAVKLEMFVFDAMPLAAKTVILETRRSEEFSPVKNATGEDSPATCLHDQVRRAAEWLEFAGVQVPRDAEGQVAAAIEISPLLADSPQRLAGKIDPNLTIAPGQSLYLGSRGQTGGLR